MQTIRRGLGPRAGDLAGGMGFHDLRGAAVGWHDRLMRRAARAQKIGEADFMTARRHRSL